jgi:hypothetical protein
MDSMYAISQPRITPNPMAYKNSESSTLATQLMSMGIHGHERITDDSFDDKRFGAFIVVTDATVTFKDYNREQFFGQKTDVTYPAGHMVVGDLRDLTVTAGSIDAYYQAGERTASDS